MAHHQKVLTTEGMSGLLRDLEQGPHGEVQRDKHEPAANYP